MTDLTRREAIAGLTTLAVAGAIAGTAGTAVAAPAPALPEPARKVQALFFDVFGTLVDWRNGVARDARRLLEPRGVNLDWIAFAEAWRSEYQPAMQVVRAGNEPFVRLDVLHRRMLDKVLPRFGLDSLDEGTRREMTVAWHRLDSWPDVVPGMRRLRQGLKLAPMSNGNIALQVDLARHNGMPWDAILGAEIAQDYKPKPRVYLAGAEALGLEPSQCMMVAAHTDDLRAAAALGLRTAHVARPYESPSVGEAAPRAPMDIAVQSLEELATAFGL